MLEDFVQPQFQEAGHGIPREGELQDDDISLQKRSLFGGNVKPVIGIETVQAADFRVWQGFCDFVEDGGVRDGGAEVGVTGDNQDVFHGFSLGWVNFL